MKFEEAAALKILFNSEEVQVVEDGKVDEGNEEAQEPPGITVTRHGIIVHDHVLWDVEEGIKELAGGPGEYGAI